MSYVDEALSDDDGPAVREVAPEGLGRRRPNADDRMPVRVRMPAQVAFDAVLTSTCANVARSDDTAQGRPRGGRATRALGEDGERVAHGRRRRPQHRGLGRRHGAGEVQERRRRLVQDPPRRRRGVGRRGGLED